MYMCALLIMKKSKLDKNDGKLNDLAWTGEIGSS